MYSMVCLSSSSLQIMRQIMAGRGGDESSVKELIKEAEEMKQNLVRCHQNILRA